MVIERVARPFEGNILRQFHRQVALRYRNDIALVTMDDRNRAAPVPLARNAPVPQSVIDFTDALRLVLEGLRFQPLCHRFLGRRNIEPVQEVGIDQPAVTDIGLLTGLELFDPGGIVGAGIENVERCHHRLDRQIVLAGKIEIPLVMGRTAEDRAGAVVHQDEIGDIDGQRQPVHEWMGHGKSGIEALLLGRFQGFLAGPEVVALGDERCQGGIVGRE